MTDLLARLEVAEAGSLELDVAIWDAMGGWSVAHPPAVTTSLDAALALAERVLPGCRCMVERDFDGNGWAMVQRSGTFNAERVMTDGNTPALALCAAVLKATHKAEGAEG